MKREPLNTRPELSRTESNERDPNPNFTNLPDSHYIYSELEILKEKNFKLSLDNESLRADKVILEARVKDLVQGKDVLEKSLEALRLKIQKYESILEISNVNEGEQSRDVPATYDFILDIGNFYDLGNSGWSLTINDPILKESTLASTLSIVGMYDKGKTFILNKLTNSDFGSSKKVKTKGLSMKRTSIDGSNFVIIDTAGFNSPMNMKKMQEREKKYTEAFIQELAYGLSDYFIIVVNDFTAKDQKFLRALMKKIESNREKQSIIVIHNFKDVESEDLHSFAWKSQVLDVFQSDDENGSQFIKVPIKNDFKDIEIYKTRLSIHFSLVNDRCAYGKEYNRFAIECIKYTLKYQIVSSKPENIYNKLKENMEKALNMELEVIPEDFCNTQPGLNNSGLKEIIKPLRDISKGDFKSTGFRLIRVDEFEPSSDLVAFEDCYKIYLDIPGMKPEELSITANTEETRFKGNRIKEHDRSDSSTHRKFGEFDLSFKIPKKYSYKYNDISLENGVLIATYKIAKVQQGDWLKKKN